MYIFYSILISVCENWLIIFKVIVLGYIIDIYKSRQAKLVNDYEIDAIYYAIAYIVNF